MTTPAKKSAAKKATPKPGPRPQAKQQEAKKEAHVALPTDSVVVSEIEFTRNHAGFAVHPNWDAQVAESGWDPLADRLTKYRWASGNPLTGTPSRKIGALR